MKFRIPIHSVIDIITNSSTEIYTYSAGTIEPLKKLINEMFKLQVIDKKFDDVFTASVLCDEETYADYSGNNYEKDDGNYKSRDEALKTIQSVKDGKLEKPEWMKEAESSYGYSDYTPNTYLYITTKDEKYNDLARLVKSFLYSTNHEASYDG